MLPNFVWLEFLITACPPTDGDTLGAVPVYRFK